MDNHISFGSNSLDVYLTVSQNTDLEILWNELPQVMRNLRPD